MTHNNAIQHFRNDHFFLSNFSVSPIKIDYKDQTFVFNTGEHCFHGMKVAASVLGIEDNLRWLNSMSQAKTPNQAKYLGRSLKINVEHWNDISYLCMKRTQELKYSQNPLLMKKLLETYPRPLIEGTSWNDTLWGVNKNGEGQNLLGKILMELRESFLNINQ